MVNIIKLFCKKESDGTYKYFFRSKIAVGMCGVKKEDIVPVVVREAKAKENEEHSHFGYLSLEKEEDQDIHFIFDNRISVEICSPNAFKLEIASGKGRIIKVVVEEV